MPNLISPGVYILEKDISEYAPSINSSVVALVGYASEGPANVPTLITSKASLISTFGSPSESITGQGLEAAMEILDDTQSLYYIRVGSLGPEGLTNAEASIPLGSCPAVNVSAGTWGVEEGGFCKFGIDRGVRFNVQVWDNDGVAQFSETQTFDVPGGLTAPGGGLFAYQGEAIASVIPDDGGMFSCKVDPLSPQSMMKGTLVANVAGVNAHMVIHAYEIFEQADGTWDLPNPAGGTEWTPIEALVPIHADGQTHGKPGYTSFDWENQFQVSKGKFYGTTHGGSEEEYDSDVDPVYRVTSLNPGSGYNYSQANNTGVSITVVEDSGTAPVNGWELVVQKHDGGLTGETYSQSFVEGATWLEGTLQTGDEGTSQLVKANVVVEGEDVDLHTLEFEGDLYSKMDPGEKSNGGTEDHEFEWVDQTYGTFNHYDFDTSTAVITTLPFSTEDWDSEQQEDQLAALKGLNPKFNQLIAGTVGMQGGADGLASVDSDITAEVIGTVTAEGKKTGIQALDNASLNISIAAIPGITLEACQNELVAMAHRTTDFIAVISPPYGVGGVQNAVNWTQGTGNLGRSAALSEEISSYAAIYWPWVKVFDVFEGTDRWLDPAIFGIKAMCRTDSVAETWFAPAGFQRGGLAKPSEVEVVLNKGDRDALYGPGNVINPVVKFPQQGIVIFGQRTAKTLPTALDRINVRRLMIYLKKVIFASTQRFVFEPNDEFTWARIEQVLIPLVSEIKDRRGITDFRVVCDETTNIPSTVDKNELWCKVLIKPTKTAEMIVFELNLTNQSAQMGTL